MSTATGTAAADDDERGWLTHSLAEARTRRGETAQEWADRLFGATTEPDEQDDR